MNNYSNRVKKTSHNLMKKLISRGFFEKQIDYTDFSVARTV
jgi:hypothetical protein